MKLVLVAIAVGVLGLGSESSAATRYVANNGVDSAACGTEGNPCRSITQAIANASTGDTILVGPGLYGDLTDGESGNLPGGTFPGEEMPPTGALARIVVDKPVTIESTHGSGATFLRDDSSYGGTVQVSASGVVLGRPGRGFGVTGRVLVDGSTSGVTVSGLVITDGALNVEGSNHSISNNSVLSSGHGNEGVYLRGSGHTFSQNLIDYGAVMLDGADSVAFTHNIVVGGTLSVSSATEVRRNTFLGSPYVGISVGPGSTATITENNIFGNWPQVYPPEGNCGLVNGSGGTIDATNNYWGAASGPGPDPADEVCDIDDSTTTVSPFATEPFPIGLPGGGGGTNGSPVCTAAQAAPAMLWPANGQLVRVWVIGVGDPENDPVAITVTGVTQDEPVSGSEVGDSGPDAILRGSSADIRAQRIPAGNGRVYRLEFSANDANGGTCSGAVTVQVPNSQKPGQAIEDDGQLYNSVTP
jgi:hypothetical protein